MAKYLDEQGLRTLWGKIKERDGNTYSNAIAEVEKVDKKVIALDGTVSGLGVTVGNQASKITALETDKANASTTYTKSEVDGMISTAKTAVKDDLLGGAGAAFDTLKELETALGQDANFATTITKKVGTVQNNLDAHTGNKSNPHGVTKAQVGLSAVVNTGDSATPVPNGTTKFTTGGAYTLKNDLIDTLSTKETALKEYTDNAVKDCVSKYGTYQGSNAQDSYAISFDSGIFKINLTNRSTGPITGQDSKAFEVSYVNGIKFDSKKLLDTSDVVAISPTELNDILV